MKKIKSLIAAKKQNSQVIGTHYSGKRAIHYNHGGKIHLTIAALPLYFIRVCDIK